MSALRVLCESSPAVIIAATSRRRHVGGLVPIMLTRFSTAVRSHLLFTAILIGYLVLAVGFSLANPIYESTDELHHFRYIRYLQQYGALPEQRADQPRIQAHHPPLYYLIAALATSWITPDHDALYEPVANPYYGYRYWEINNDNKNRYLHGPDEAWPYHGVVLMVHVARWVNVLLGAIMVWVTYQIGLTIFPKRKWLAAGAAAIVAFNPQFLFMSGAVNNDVIAGLFGSILLWQGVTIIRDGLTTRRSICLVPRVRSRADGEVQSRVCAAVDRTGAADQRVAGAQARLARLHQSECDFANRGGRHRGLVVRAQLLNCTASRPASSG